MGFISEFKTFIARGNVMDMAVGVVVGGSFNSIVTSFTKSILTPVISCLTGRVNIEALSVKISEELVIPYGEFLQSVINFLLTAAVLFAFIKVINSVRGRMERLYKEEEKEQTEEEKKPTSEELLGEIRDLLKSGAKD